MEVIFRNIIAHITYGKLDIELSVFISIPFKYRSNLKHRQDINLLKKVSYFSDLIYIIK